MQWEVQNGTGSANNRKREDKNREFDSRLSFLSFFPFFLSFIHAIFIFFQRGFKSKRIKAIIKWNFILIRELTLSNIFFWKNEEREIALNGSGTDK